MGARVSRRGSASRRANFLGGTPRNHTRDGCAPQKANLFQSVDFKRLFGLKLYSFKFGASAPEEISLLLAAAFNIDRATGFEHILLPHLPVNGIGYLDFAGDAWLSMRLAIFTVSPQRS